MEDYYAILGVSRDVPDEVIKAVYRAWMCSLRMHPDLGGDSERAKKINAAYDVLGNSAKRAEYDMRILHVNKSFGENRQTPRFDVKAIVSCCIGNDSVWHRAEVLDAGVMGMGMLSNFSINVGDHISVAFLTSSVSVEAVVKWTRQLSHGRLKFGIKFFTPIPDILEKLTA